MMTAFVLALALGSDLESSVFSCSGTVRGQTMKIVAIQDLTPALAEARRLINAGEARAALAKLRALPTESDVDRQTQIAHLLGVAYYHADEPVKAIETLGALVDRMSSDSVERREAEQILGLAAFAVGRFADAIPRLEATRRWAPDNLELAYALGQAYIQTQRPDDARRVIASAYRVAPDSAAAHLIAAQTMVRLEMEDQASTELARALAKDPRMPNANYLLGQMALLLAVRPQRDAEPARVGRAGTAGAVELRSRLHARVRTDTRGVPRGPVVGPLRAA